MYVCILNMILTEDTLNDWIIEQGGFLITRRTYNVKNYDFENSKNKDGISYACLTGYENVLYHFFSNFINKYSNKVVVVIIESDKIPLKKEWLDHPNLEHCYTWNKPFHHPKLSALPIGLNYKRQYDIITNWLQEYKKKKSKKIKNKKKIQEHNKWLCMNCSLYTNRSRGLLINKAKKEWRHFCDLLPFVPNSKSYYIKSEVDGQILVNVTNPKCYDRWKHYKFVLSPQGTGIDCHRTWEALLMGCIPIVLSSNLDELYKDLPIVVLQSWNDINKGLLEKEYARIIQNKKNNVYNMEKLTLEYWQNKIVAHKDTMYILQSKSNKVERDISEHIHFITYGSGPFEKAKKRLLQEARDFGEFKTIKGYGQEDLPKEFLETYKDIMKKKRGGGYWIWRPLILLDYLEKVKDNDYVVYLDAGCSLNKKAKKRFFEYIHMLKKSDYGIMSFQMSGNNGPGTLEIEKKWTIKEIFDHLNVDINSDIANSGQYLGGVLVMKKNKHLLDYLQIYKDCIEQHADLCTDKFDMEEHQIPEFIENRHEQSITSILRKIHGSVVIDGDESWMPPFGSGQSLFYPFWATRKRS